MAEAGFRYSDLLPAGAAAKLADRGPDVPALLAGVDWARAGAILAEQLPAVPRSARGVA